jgi:hypothetical protein
MTFSDLIRSYLPQMSCTFLKDSFKQILTTAQVKNIVFLDCDVREEKKSFIDFKG